MPTTLRPQPARKYGSPRCCMAITSSGSALNTTRNSWSSPPNTCATVAQLEPLATRHWVPTQASSSRHSGRAVSTSRIRWTKARGTSGRSRLTTGPACQTRPTSALARVVEHGAAEPRVLLGVPSPQPPGHEQAQHERASTERGDHAGEDDVAGMGPADVE